MTITRNIHRHASKPSHRSLLGSAGDVCKRIVDRQRQEDAGDDRELLQGAQPASDAGRRRLGDVGRRDHRRHTDTDTADDSEETSSQTLFARPVPSALMKNSTAAIFMTDIRPIRSAMRPAVIAPAAAPSNADATAKPSA